MSQIKQFALLLTVAGALGAIAGIKDGIPMERLSSSHPRLLVGREQFAALKQNAQAPAGQALAARIRHDAELILGYPPQPREMIGRRLLSASRNVLYRVNTLAVAFRLTGKREYADRAIREMLNAASYSDWNPSHFLDVGEMTLAVAVGYDWLYELLTPEQRSAIELAIIDKGLKPSFQGKQGWVRGTNNWNAVCHAGMVAGALAVADREPELARRVAVKILNEESEENDGGRRFLEEAKLVAKINHPGVIPIYNCGVAEGRPFLVMRYMENGSVEELLRRDGLADVSMTAGWMANIAEGLEFALRQQSVVHHDIKPGNILLTSEWEAKLGDFDLADVRETGDALTLCDGWASPGYVSPERLLYGGSSYLCGCL